MAAVLGLATARGRGRLRRGAPAGGEVAVAANLNAPDQTVISGDPAAVERAGEGCKARGAKRVLPLKVSGAFHSPLMAPAVAGLATALDAAPFGEPRVPGRRQRHARDPVTTGARRAAAPRRPAHRAGALGRVHADRAAELVPDARFVEIGPGHVLSVCSSGSCPAPPASTLGTADEVEKFLGA